MSLSQEVQFAEIILRRLPAGWRTAVRHETDRQRGACDFKSRTLSHPPLKTRRDLFVALHEVGHATMHHQTKMAPHVEEYEAEQFAILVMKLEGIPVPRIELALARANVRVAIIGDVASGHYKIDPTIKRWSKT